MLVEPLKRMVGFSDVVVSTLEFEDVDVHHNHLQSTWSYETTELRVVVEIGALGQEMR